MNDTTTTATASDLDRPAICWDAAASNDSAYWDSANCHLPIQSNDGITWLMYRDLLLQSARLALLLHARIERQLQKEVSKSLSNIKQQRANYRDYSCNIPIVVAIPQGIFLPLVISALYAMNTRNVVLIPLDPGDAEFRIAHVIGELRPLFLLVAADCDATKLEQVVERTTLSFKDDKVLPTHETKNASCCVEFNGMQMYATREMQVLDVRELIANNDDDLNDNLVEGLESLLKDSDFFCEPWDRQILRILQSSLSLHTKNSSCWASTDNDDKHTDNRMSHICYTSGTTGIPKGCVSSRRSLVHYMHAKNKCHGITSRSRVLLASSISFDPCFSDCLATFANKATLVIVSKQALLQNLFGVLHKFQITHVLCTPTLWSSTMPSCWSASDDNDDDNTHKSTRAIAFQSLEVIALGGEPIPRQIVQQWARASTSTDVASTRLFATYGVTEACVYQTMGEILKEDGRIAGQNVGLPMDGMSFRICDEQSQELLVDTSVGEVVLYGNQLDVCSLYWNRPDETRRRFVNENGRRYYRTGDRGYKNHQTGTLVISGRIQGENGMVKVNGVRVELGDIEEGIVDDCCSVPVVTQCIAAMVPSESTPDNESCSVKCLIAYVVLSAECLKQLKITKVPVEGAICTVDYLLTLLRQRCKKNTNVVPRTFVAIPRTPLSRTGKRDRQQLPRLEDAVSLTDLIYETTGDKSAILLREYGQCGHTVSEKIIDCLNLNIAQQSMLKTTATFSMLGGDSLSATRLTRALYAMHHDIPDSRFVGGDFGVLDGSFSITKLLSSRDLGAYVDWLDSEGVHFARGDVTCVNIEERQRSCIDSLDNRPYTMTSDESQESIDKRTMYDGLIKAIMQRQFNIAIALLDIGADPNFESVDVRLSKVSGRLGRKMAFRSSPLHIACAAGNSQLVAKLLFKKARFNVPDASASFPIHLVVAGVSSEVERADDERNRIECLSLLLNAGAPISMKDGNEQTLLHVAARLGRCKLLVFILEKWLAVKHGNLDWRDHWGRTAVHWAVLNGHVEALGILLEMGCSPKPVKITSRSTSLRQETPAEMCSRLYGSNPSTANQIMQLLTCERGKTQCTFCSALRLEYM
jgi:acyl-CoA synthetase (AMP-forming)/AMP-acid ligase II/ankyrin repeat protein